MARARASNGSLNARRAEKNEGEESADRLGSTDGIVTRAACPPPDVLSILIPSST